MSISTHPLHNAIDEGNIPLVRQLIESGVNLEKLDSDGNTPFLICCLHRPVLELIELLIESESNINAVNNNGENPLFIAVEREMGYLSTILLKNDSDVNVVRLDDNTSPLFWSVYKGQVDLAFTLIEKGANPNIEIPNADSGTTLQWAVDLDNFELVKKLMHHGAELNAPGVLHAAIRHIPILRYLISQGADVNMKGNLGGSTALHMAAYTCNTEAVKVLIESGADKKIRDNDDGQIPSEWATEGDCTCKEIARLLE